MWGILRKIGAKCMRVLSHPVSWGKVALDKWKRRKELTIEVEERITGSFWVTVRRGGNQLSFHSCASKADADAYMAKVFKAERQSIREKQPGGRIRTLYRMDDVLPQQETTKVDWHPV